MGDLAGRGHFPLYSVNRRWGRPVDVLPDCRIVLVAARDAPSLVRGVEPDVMFLESFGWRRQLYFLQRPASSSLFGSG